MDDVEIAMRELSRLPAKKQKDEKPEKRKFTPPFELLTVHEVADALRLSSNTIYRMINKSNSCYVEIFPQPVRVTSHSTMWRSDEITEYMLNMKRGAEVSTNGRKKTPNAKQTPKTLSTKSKNNVTG